MNAQAALVAGMVRHFRLMLTVGTVATLVACGGGGADPAPVPSATPPSITSHPVSQTVQDGQSATFSVSATGDAPLTYQWQRGGADVPWATGTTYTLGNAQMSNDGTFWTARVTNPAGSVVSAGATLSVQAAPASGTVTLFAGDVEQMGTSDGRGSVARFNRPQGLALDAAGNVLVADLLNHTIRKIQPDGLVSTLAGVPGVNGSANGIGGAARFQRPVGVAMGADGLLYVLDGWELFVPLTLAWHSIRTVSPQGQVETPYSWQMTLTPAGIAPGADGDAYATVRNRGVTLFSRGNPPVTLAGRDTGQLEGSGALVRDAAGNIYYSSGNSVQKRAIDGTVTLFAGSVAEAGSADVRDPMQDLPSATAVRSLLRTLPLMLPATSSCLIQATIQSARSRLGEL